ncbi:DUF2441 domain-containing protein [Agrobacterium tumefaciens]|uniref:DUF2441 domain-containing protein n=1 Tax=Agrobacterium tumefaciens TaxID=358 RepID=UPI000DD5C7A6|nr:DUF2441 domain-containing protein [Agrobacterium tumefaciens]
MGIFYHCAPIKLGVGSIIEPGNWGRIISLVAYRHNHYHREMVFEHVRSIVKPQAPSRMDALFAFMSLEEAREYCALENLRASLIYECETIDDDAKTYLGPLNAFALKTNEFDMAAQYWNGCLLVSEASTASPHFMGVGKAAYEVFTTSSLRIISPATAPF